MLGIINKTLNKVFGTKSDRDVKSALPMVEAINESYETLQTLSDDELRAKTDEFKAQIQEHLAEIDQEIEATKQAAEDLPATELDEKLELYKQADELIKEKDKQVEEILEELLPEAFAVVKDTARRLKENGFLQVTASQNDRDLAASNPHIKIEGDQATYANKWMAAGNEVTWDMLHYDVQLIGGIVLHQGKIAEMATGEGKTLVATLPAYLNALAGLGVHIVTVNDYLARRDSEWMAPIFQFHGLSIDCIDKYPSHSEERRKAYNCDITYGTNNEFGFDYLRDNMAHSPDDLVQRKHHFAMIDEVDSVLVDEARTPLIISGPIPKGDQHEFHELKPRIQRLVDVQKKLITGELTKAKKAFKEGNLDEAGIPLLRAFRGLPKNKALIKFLSETGVRTHLQKTEAFYMQNQNKEMHVIDDDLYFVIDEKNNQIDLTDKGIDLITANGEDPNFFILTDVGTAIADLEKEGLEEKAKATKKDAILADFAVKSERIHSVNQLLKAYALFEVDVDYIVDENKVKIVDEQTGRVMDGRRYSDGLHQALEAKENVKVEAATQTHATITLQNFFRMYHKLAGMTGTAETEAGELWEIYKLDVVVIPTNRPIVRDDREDLVYKTAREKYNAAIVEIEKLVEAGRPVLVGTTSVEISEILSRMLNMRKIRHNVLNAKRHQREAEIVAEAGQAGTVTIATNMAGRGTDIKLGKGVKDAGGLAIIGTERHDSRRVDRQLRGRAGRQGDPGSSQFFVSLEDDLMRKFGSERIAKVMDRFGYNEGEVIQHSMISKSIERAQKKVEENNFGIRKHLLEYDDVMNTQREFIYKKRKHALFGERLKSDISDMIYNVTADSIVFHQEKIKGEKPDFDAFKMEVLTKLSVDTKITEEELKSNSEDDLIDVLFKESLDAYEEKNQRIAEMAHPQIKEIYEDQSNQYERIAIPFVMGNKQIPIVSDFKTAYETESKSVIEDFEKGVALALIDETWKEHLRQMDELRKNVQNARFEQKDPLLIYKFEAFELFKEMSAELSAQTISMLAHGKILMDDTRQARKPNRRSNRNFTANKPDLDGRNSNPEQRQQPERKKVETVRTGPKVGRNAPCPCGSGKKYKHCHGK